MPLGLECLDVDDAALLGPKNVEGLMRGYEDKDGGGTPVGNVCVEEANDAWAMLGSAGAGIEPPLLTALLRTPPAAKTAGGIACMSVSR